MSPKRIKDESFNDIRESRDRINGIKSPKEENQKKEEKVVITGDDILIEYVKRLTLGIKNSL